ncbi:SIMPL domain-containing protein [Kribbella sp. WER1]
MKTGVRVVGSGQASAEPDVLRMSLAVEHSAPDVAAAVVRVAELTDAVTATLRAQGVAASAIRTTEVEVSQEYQEPGRPRTFRGAHLLTVTTRDLTGFGRLLNAAVDAAGNGLNLHSIRFDVEDKAALLTRARELAFQQAREKAAELAGLAGYSLGAVTSVAETYSQHPARGVALAAKAAFESEIHLTPGDTSLEVSLDVHFAWA